MSFEQNKAIVRRFLEDIVNRGQFEIAEEIFAVDYINHTAGGGIGSGRDGFVKSIKAARAVFPDWTVTVNAMIAEGDLVCDHVSIRATHSGQAPGGAAPTHEAISWRSHAFVAPVGWAACRGMVLRHTGGDSEGVCRSIRTHAEIEIRSCMRRMRGGSRCVLKRRESDMVLPWPRDRASLASR